MTFRRGWHARIVMLMVPTFHESSYEASMQYEGGWMGAVEFRGFGCGRSTRLGGR